MSSMESNGRLVNDYDEYRKLLLEAYIKTWIDADNEDINRVFGVPKRYPVVITLRTNKLDAFNNKQMHFVYLSKNPTVYTYSESEY